MVTEYWTRCDYGTSSYSTTNLLYYTDSDYVIRPIKYNSTDWYGAISTASNSTIDYCYTGTSNNRTTTAIEWLIHKGLYRLEPGWEVGTPRISPQERLRQIIRTRQAPAIIGTRKPLLMTKDVKEIRARETLYRVLGEEKFRSFMRNGFVSVRGKSGKTYQIFPGHGFTKVYQGGQLVERLCVVLSGSFPPTDSLIMRFLLILNDENEFRQLANKHNVFTPAAIKLKQVDLRPLTEIYRGLVAA